MKVYLLSIAIVLLNNLSAQKSVRYTNKELDTAFFDFRIYNKYFEHDSKLQKYHTPNNINFKVLELVASFNNYLGTLNHDIAIKTHFKFKDSLSFKSVSFEFEGHPIHFTFKKDNGVNLDVDNGFEGMQPDIGLTEYKNAEKNGIYIHYYNGPFAKDTFIFEIKYFKDDYPIGKYYSYYQNGQIKEEGDSTHVFNKRLEEEESTDLKGNITSTRMVKAYDTEKKGYWRTYNPKGELIKQEYFK